MAGKGTVYLIPNTLGTESHSTTIPSGIADQIKDVDLIFVEHPKAARKLLIGLGLKSRLDNIEMISIKNGIQDEDKKYASNQLSQGNNIGILSDAGCPAIADP